MLGSVVELVVEPVPVPRLPPELLTLIFSHLRPSERAVCATVYRQWRSACLASEGASARRHPQVIVTIPGMTSSCDAIHVVRQHPPDTGRLTGVGVGSSPGDLPQGGHANAVFQRG